jgi:phage host-nuclease inhibitor protein Gam
MLLMPKGSVEEIKKAQFDASVKEQQSRMRELSRLKGEIESLEIELQDKKRMAEEEFSEFLLDMEAKKNVLRAEIRTLKNEKELLSL